MCAKNMWGNLGDLEKTGTPTSILREQGNILYEKTDRVLLGEAILRMHKNRFLIDFNIVARQLNEYRYTLFTVSHGIDIYPLDILDHVRTVSYSCETEKRFLEVLEEILSSAEVRKILQSLISQSAS